MVLALLYVLAPNRAMMGPTSPCCVPTSYSPLSLLYMNVNGTIELKKYENMVVETCGCKARL